METMSISSPSFNDHSYSYLNLKISIPFSAFSSFKTSCSSKSRSLTLVSSSSYGGGTGRVPAGDDVIRSPVKLLRKVLEYPGIHLGPACFDALSAKLVERAGFDFCFTTGFGISAARLGLPDTGLISFGEMVDQGRQITEAVSIPIVGDGDNGYGSAMNVKRTVKGYIKSGFAGIILEDQVSPKACGHTQGRRVVPREEAVMKIKAAVDARKESGSDIVIVARTDSRQAVSLEESLWRSSALADAGADVLFIDALVSKEEMEAFCEVSPLVPKMANMLEGGGRTPILSPIELADVGYKIVAYPLSLMGVSIRAMQQTASASSACQGNPVSVESESGDIISVWRHKFLGGRMPSPGNMPSFEEIKEILGFNAYYDEEMRYDTKINQLPIERGYPSTSSTSYSTQQDVDKSNQGAYEAVVEVLTPEKYRNYDADGSEGPFSGIWSRKLRVKITGRDGSERFDVRIPAGVLNGITNTIPAFGGINLKALLDDAALEEGGKQLLDFEDRMGDRIQVFLE